MLTITYYGCAVVGLFGAMVGVLFIAATAMIVDWLRRPAPGEDE